MTLRYFNVTNPNIRYGLCHFYFHLFIYSIFYEYYFLFSFLLFPGIFKCKLLVKNISLAKLLLYRRRATSVDFVLKSLLSLLLLLLLLLLLFIRLRSHGKGQVFAFVHTEPFNKNFD